MKKALVLGASGGMGFALTEELLNRGYEVIAFARTKQKLEQLFHHKQIKIVSGDALNQADLLHAATGVDIIFHSVNVPYQHWSKQLLPIMDNVLSVAKQTGAKIAIVDNIYAYGRNPDHLVTEETIKRPHTKKGKIRLQLEALANKYQKDDVDSVFAHFPDFYGPNADNTMLGVTINSALKGKRPMFVGRLDVEREYIYTRDGAKALVHLAENKACYGEHWNIPATSTISGYELLTMLKKLTGNNKKPFVVTPLMIRLIGLFNPFMREMNEMMYLTEEPVVLSGVKYESVIGEVPKTSYEKGLEEIIKEVQ